MTQNLSDHSSSSSSSRLEIQKRLQERLKTRTDTTSRPTPRTFEQLPLYMQMVLPSHYTYIVKSYKELELQTFAGAPNSAFDSTFYVNISSIEAIEQWKAAFHKKTGTIFRITRADKVKGIKVIYHKDFHCRHADIAAIKYMQKTYAQKAGQRRNRNTNCQCLAKIRLEKSRLQLSHPCEVHLTYNHNHPLETSLDGLNNSIIINNNIYHHHNHNNNDNNINNNNIEENNEMNNTTLITTFPNTPSNISTSSDESGRNTPQYELDLESNIESDMFNETDYCNGLLKFIDPYGRARTHDDSNPSTFFNQFTWSAETSTDGYSYDDYSNSFIESDDDLQNLTIVETNNVGDNNENDDNNNNDGDNDNNNSNNTNSTFTSPFLDYYPNANANASNIKDDNTSSYFHNNNDNNDNQSIELLLSSASISNNRSTTLKRSASDYYPDYHYQPLHRSSSLKRRSTTGTRRRITKTNSSSSSSSNAPFMNHQH